MQAVAVGVFAAAQINLERLVFLVLRTFNFFLTVNIANTVGWICAVMGSKNYRMRNVCVQYYFSHPCSTHKKVYKLPSSGALACL